MCQKWRNATPKMLLKMGKILWKVVGWQNGLVHRDCLLKRW